MADKEEGSVVGTGTVKSFSSRHGYGFIENDAGGADLHFTSDHIPVAWQNIGLKLVNQEVQFFASTSPDGKPRAHGLLPSKVPGITDQVAGVVKMWNPAKGYGFLNVPGLDSDVLFARNRLPENCKGLDRMDGMVYLFTLAEGEAGKLQAIELSLPDDRDRRQSKGGNEQQGAQNVVKQNNNRGHGLGVTLSGQAVLPTFSTPRNGDSRKRAPESQHSNPPKMLAMSQDSELFQGQVKNYFAAKGFGFIICDQFQEDIIYQGRDAAEEVAEGDEVVFEVRSNNNGRPQAYQVGSAAGQVTHKQTAHSNTAGTLDQVKMAVQGMNVRELAELSCFTSAVLRDKCGRI